MNFCTKCGKELRNDDRFCPGCGVPIDIKDNKQRQQVFEGNIHKCPNCGETIRSFTSNCPTCGFEFRNVTATSTVKQLSKQLQDLEMLRTSKFGDTTNEKKIELIRNFPIPNTKEDIIEFMLLTSSNTDEKMFDRINKYNPEKKLAEAWLTKMNQVYEKAKVVLRNDPDTGYIHNLYVQKTNAIERIEEKGKKEVSKAKFGCICIWFVLIISMIIVNSFFSNKEDRMEKQLNDTYIEIQYDIEHGDFDAALKKANTLYFDRSIDQEKADKWDEKREDIIEEILKKKGTG